MPKQANIPLQLVKAAGVALTSRLLRIGPLKDGTTYIRMTSIDKDEVYDFAGGLCDDALGPQTFYAATGLQTTTIEATNDLSVDNAEIKTLSPIFPMPGITDELVITGQLDTVPYVLIEHGVFGGAGEHEIMASGVLGQCRIEQGLVVIPELRSWSELLNQTGIISQTSIDCRSKQFGSQPGDEREYCGFDLTGEWQDFTVSAVGDETVREFYTGDLAEADYPSEDGEGYFAPGLMKWFTGANAGSSLEVESFTGAADGDDAYISLRFTARKPIQVGDTGRIRRDCTRKWSGHNSCQTYFAADRGAHFRGEPLINIGDSTANSVPGAHPGGVETNNPLPSDGPAGAGGSGSAPSSRTRGTTVVTVSAFAAATSDATAEIQAAIDSLPGDGGTVIIPAADTPYMINTTRITGGGGLALVDYMWLQLADGATLQAKTNTQDRDYVLLIQNKTQVEVSGGTIIGDRDSFVPQSGTTSEHGHGIAVYGSDGVTIRDITLTKCVGDGISVGGHSGVGSTDVVIDNVTSSHNRRQGLSLVEVDGCLVTDSTFSDISGTSPECGIDIEPEAGQVCTNITIQNCHLTRNKKYGLNILQRAGAGTIDGVTVIECLVDYQESNGAVTSGGTNVEFDSCTITLNSATGLKCANTSNLSVHDNTFKDNYTRNGIDATETAGPIVGIDSPTTDPDLLITSSASGESIGSNTYYT